jgi:hypothetical protein
VHIFYQGMDICRLTGTVPAVSDTHSGRRAVTVGSISTDTSGRFADTTVSPPVTEAARRIAALRARAGGV